MDQKNKVELKRVKDQNKQGQEEETIVEVGHYKNVIAENEPLNIDEPITQTAETNSNTQEAAKPEKEKAPFVTVKFNKYNKPITDDAKSNKNIAWLAYLLFFIPLCMPTKRNSEFVRFHANEGLEINIIDLIAIVLIVLGACIPHNNALVHLFMMIFTFVGVALLILTTITKIYMIVITLQGKQISTPWLWEIKLIK